MSAITLWMALAVAQPAPEPAPSQPLSKGQAIDVTEAAALGMPRLHEPFVDCQCVGMTWSAGNADPLVLELPKDTIGSIRHDVLDGPHELRLVLASGDELLLEQAPCQFVALATVKYSAVLGIPALTVDAAGEAVVDACGPPIIDIESIGSMRKRAMAAELVRIDDRKRARMELVSAKGEPQVVLGVRSTLDAAVMGAGQCFGRAPVPPNTRVDVTVLTRGGGSRFKARPIGVDAVDQCFDELASQLPFPTGKAKVRVAYVRAAE